MATALRRCLYIGLGGTGMNALLHTKKMFMETYGGKVPSMIGFLGIDTDDGVYNKSLDSRYGTVMLDPFEQCSISSSGAKDIYNRQRDKFSWIPEENEGAIVGMTIGAGQVRTNGRLAVTINARNVETAINSALTRIQDAKITSNREFELLANNAEIHMVFSMCGGTGAGSFIDMAYLIKHIAPNSKLIGYAVLPDVFETMVPNGPAMAKVKPNTYGAIKDLDWLMHLRPSSQPVVLDYLFRVQEENERPFNAIMLIDNKNENNDVYTHVDQLTEMISLSLVIAAGKLSVATASVSDNIEKYYTEGVMDVDDKKAWVAGMGACEIIFRGNDLAEIYSIKSIQRLINRLINECNDIDTIVNSWIDSPEVNIRENNGFDNVIDYMMSKEPTTPMVAINEPLNARPEVEMYISTAKVKDKDISKKIEDLSIRTKKELKKLLIKYINQECGIGSAENIILNIQRQFSIFLTEMQDELEILENRISIQRQSIDIAIDSLSELERKTFVINRAGKREGLTEDVIAATMQYVISEREIQRRRAAITFYNGLQANLQDEYSYISNIKKLLFSVNTELSVKLAEVYNRVGQTSQMFQIDLASEVSKNITVDDKQLDLQDFINQIKLENRVYDFEGKKISEIQELFKQYTDQLTMSKKWRNTSIDNIIDELNEDDYEHYMRIAISKAMPLLKKNYQGYMTQTPIYEGYYVGLPDKDNSRLVRNNSFRNMQSNTIAIDFVSTGMKDRIILYRQMGVIPAYAIAALRNYQEKFDNCRTFCNFDANVITRMNREGYSIYPQKQEDNTLDLWVHGLIFGLIKNEDNTYKYRNKKGGDPLLDYWVDMNTQYRDEAFEYFKRNKSIIASEFTEHIDNETNKRGTDEMMKFKQYVKSNYLESYAQLKMNRDVLLKRENEKIAGLIRQELAFVEKNI